MLGLILPEDEDRIAEASMRELEELCQACGLEVAGKSLQRRASMDPATAAGKGKIFELADMAHQLEATCLIFDGELTGSQMTAISELSELKVLDRTLLILDIFARRAKTSEGVLQVEIAQLQDRLSRLSGSGQALSRLGGGIGTRGPGESKLESDRRYIQNRITKLKRKLQQVAKRRQFIRDQREGREAYTIAVCGYTNAGKSSLINALCASDLEAYDQVFATLDPLVRRLPQEGPELLLTDTVGFIRRLPHQLVEAFKSTLDEVRTADFILQVTDISDPEAAEHWQMVDDLLFSLDAGHKPRLHVLNKVDLLAPDQLAAVDFLPRSRDDKIHECWVSVRTGQGLDNLRQAILSMVSQDWEQVSWCIPYSDSAKLALLRQQTWINQLEYGDEDILVSFLAPRPVISRLGLA
ncbi:MAG: GTPase HflX [Clostridiales bacterium]|nr:GTPase HflX [Clostridiales bacterium]